MLTEAHVSVADVRRCVHDMRAGVYLAQTVNAPTTRRDGQVYSMYHCGPGVLRQCLRCIHCGHAIT